MADILIIYFMEIVKLVPFSRKSRRSDDGEA